jgi:predicted GNAT family N-acyltransferase
LSGVVHNPRLKAGVIGKLLIFWALAPIPENGVSEYLLKTFLLPEYILLFLCIMVRIEKFTISDKEKSEAAFSIRRTVFVEEQQVPAEEEFDEYESSSEHYLAYWNNTPVATARWRHTDKGIKLERFAVLKEYRDKGTGSSILKAVLEDVVPFGKTIYLHAQIKAVKFYERAGFEKEGDIFSECDILHYTMKFKS